jgi:hypothetical protein
LKDPWDILAMVWMVLMVIGWVVVPAVTWAITALCSWRHERGFESPVTAVENRYWWASLYVSAIAAAPITLAPEWSGRTAWLVFGLGCLVLVTFFAIVARATIRARRQELAMAGAN